MRLTVLDVVVEWAKWSFSINLDIWPLNWNLGLSFDAADPEAFVPTHSLVFNFPTLQLSIEWTTIEAIEALEEHLALHEDTDS